MFKVKMPDTGVQPYINHNSTYKNHNSTYKNDLYMVYDLLNGGWWSFTDVSINRDYTEIDITNDFVCAGPVTYQFLEECCRQGQLYPHLIPYTLNTIRLMSNIWDYHYYGYPGDDFKKLDYKIFCYERSAWWKSGGHGYTIFDEMAGLYSYDAARETVEYANRIKPEETMVPVGWCDIVKEYIHLTKFLINEK